MNLQITLNNNELLRNTFKDKQLNEKQKHAVGVLKDDYDCLMIMNDLIIEKDKTIADQFRHSAELAINETKQKKLVLERDKEILSLKALIKEMEKKVNDVLDAF